MSLKTPDRRCTTWLLRYADHMIVLLVSIAGVWTTSAVGLVWWGRTRVAPRRADAIVVAGCLVHEDGRPTTALRARAETAVSLFQQGCAPRIVFTGGAKGGRLSEADAAATVARDAGVPESAIVLEDQSMTTLENARCSADLVSGTHVIVVSDAYHLARCRWIFRRHFEQVSVVAAPWRGSWKMAYREVVASLLSLPRS